MWDWVLKRDTARDLVYKIIFQMSFHEDFSERYEKMILDNKITGVQGEYAKKTIKGILDNLENIDQTIKDNLIGWKFERLSNHVIAVLRLGVYEIIYNDDIPALVALNEAVSLAHTYSDEKEASFVNGLLNSVYKKVV